MAKKIIDELREQYVATITAAMSAAGEEVLRTNSNEIAFPVVDADGGEHYIVVTVKIPTGTRDGDEYDGYMEAQAYADKLVAKKAKAEEAAAKKAAKIARDEAARAARKAAKEAAKMQA